MWVPLRCDTYRQPPQRALLAFCPVRANNAEVTRPFLRVIYTFEKS